jgi:hypothetical protein
VKERFAVQGVLIFVLLVLYLICMGIKGLFRLVTGEARREREETARQEEGQRRREAESAQRRAAERQAREDAKARFQQAVVDGRFPGAADLVIISDSEERIPVDPKEALEELLWGECTLREMAYADGVRLIQQMNRVNQRAQARAARDDRTAPLTRKEAFELLGVTARYTPEQLTEAYHRKVCLWHPDKLDAMAQELKDFATRETARLNEAYRLLKSST